MLIDKNKKLNFELIDRTGYVFLKEKCCGENYESLRKTFSKESLFFWIFKTYWHRKKRLKIWKEDLFSHKEWLILKSPKEEQKLRNLLYDN